MVVAPVPSEGGRIIFGAILAPVGMNTTKQGWNEDKSFLLSRTEYLDYQRVFIWSILWKYIKLAM